MPISKISKRAVQEIGDEISPALSDEDKAKISTIIESALLESVRQTVQGCKSAVVVCCGPEADLAHKIAEEMELKRDALVANLYGLR